MSIKQLIKNRFLPSAVQTIFSGPSKGMKIRYDINNRFQHLLGFYEREIYKYLQKGFAKAKTLIDVGANDGYYVLAMLKTGKKVIACEPGIANEEIVSNASLNGFELNKHYQLITQLIGNGNTNDFVSMKTLLATAERPVFILVDIDGAEFDLLQSCGEELDYKNIIWLFETHSPELEKQCIDFLKGKGYNITLIKNAWWRFLVKESRPLEQNRWFYAEHNHA